MLHNQSNGKIESEIEELFRSIKFKKEENQKLLQKWHRQSMQGLDPGYVQMDSSPSESATARTYNAEVRIELARRLQEIALLLQNQDEAAAENLLKHYAGAVSKGVMYFAVFMLVFVLGTIIWLNLTMYS